MKKVILTLIACAIACTAFAGRPTGLRLGGGYSMNFYKADVDGSSLLGGDMKLDNTNYLGGFVEVGYDWAFTQHSTLCVGARFNMLFNGKLSDDLIKGEGWAFSGQLTNKSYIDIPVMYQFAFNLSPKVQMFFAAGPTVNFWLNNSTTYTFAANVKSQGSSQISTTNWFNDNIFGKDFYNKVNVSLGGQAGVYFYHVKVYVGYDQSVTSFTNKQYGNSSLGQLRIGAAYVF